MLSNKWNITPTFSYSIYKGLLFASESQKHYIVGLYLLHSKYDISAPHHDKVHCKLIYLLLFIF